MTQGTQNESDRIQKILKVLRNFWVILLFILIGMAIGLVSKRAGQGMLVGGRFYLSLLGMTVTPIVFAAVTSSVGRLLRQGAERNLLKRIVVVFTIAVLIASTVGVVGALISRPGASLDKEKENILGRLLQREEVPHLEHERGHPSGLLRFAHEVIPDNIFRIFSEDRKLAIVFLSLLMGVAIGVSNTDSSAKLLEILDAVYEIFVRILYWLLYLLPFGLCALTAGLTATLGVDLLSAISHMLAAFYVCCVIMWLIYMVVIRMATGKSFSSIFSSLKDPLALAFFSNSLVAMPLTMKHLHERLHQPDQVVKLVVPLGVAMNRHAYPLLFAFMAVFVAQVFRSDLSYYDLMEISIAAALVGMAAVGNTAVVAPLLAVVLEPLELPHILAVIIVVQCAGILNPMVKITNIFGCCATLTIIAAPWAGKRDA